MTSPIRVLVIDDSATIRRILKSLLSAEADIEVVGTLADGKEGLSAVQHLRPDVVTLDLEMPDVDGLTLLRRMRERRQDVPVIVVSGARADDRDLVVEALAAGATEFVAKPDPAADPGWARFKPTLLDRVRTLGRANIVGRTSMRAPPAPGPIPGAPIAVDFSWRAVVVASSTGGPAALSELLAELPEDFGLPILVVQHMPAGFTSYLVERLGRAGRLPVVAGEDGLAVEPGRVVIAPAGRHMVLRRDPRGIVTMLHDEPPVVGCRPAADVLFRAAAEVYGKRAAAVVLTGMGQDGLEGSRALKKLGAMVFAQDVASSVVWGMPGQVVSAKLADYVGPPARLARELLARWQRQSVSHASVVIEEAPRVPRA